MKINFITLISITIGLIILNLFINRNSLSWDVLGVVTIVLPSIIIAFIATIIISRREGKK